MQLKKKKMLWWICVECLHDELLLLFSILFATAMHVSCFVDWLQVWARMKEDVEWGCSTL